MSNVPAGRYSLTGLPPFQPMSVFSGSTLATLYADKITGTTITNPVLADDVGSLSFFAAPGDYTLQWVVGDVKISTAVTVRPDPGNPLVGGTFSIVSGSGVPAIAGTAGFSLYLRTDAPNGSAQTNIYACTVTGGAGSATWVPIA